MDTRGYGYIFTWEEKMETGSQVKDKARRRLVRFARLRRKG